MVMEITNIIEFIKDAEKAAEKGEAALNAFALTYRSQEIYMALELFASQFNLIIYTKVAARKPKFRVDIRSSKKVISEKENDLRLAAIKAMLSAHSRFVVITPSQRAAREKADLFSVPRIQY
jgi:hypothetical protein